MYQCLAFLKLVAIVSGTLSSYGNFLIFKIKLSLLFFLSCFSSWVQNSLNFHYVIECILDVKQIWKYFTFDSFSLKLSFGIFVLLFGGKLYWMLFLYLWCMLKYTERRRNRKSMWKNEAKWKTVGVCTLQQFVAHENFLFVRALYNRTLGREGTRQDKKQKQKQNKNINGVFLSFSLPSLLLLPFCFILILYFFLLKHPSFGISLLSSKTNSSQITFLFCYLMWSIFSVWIFLFVCLSKIDHLPFIFSPINTFPNLAHHFSHFSFLFFFEAKLKNLSNPLLQSQPFLCL